MKHIIIAICLVISGMACQSQPQANAPTGTESTYNISGKVKSVVSGKVYLERMNDRNIPLRIDWMDLSAHNSIALTGKMSDKGNYLINNAI